VLVIELPNTFKELGKFSNVVIFDVGLYEYKAIETGVDVSNLLIIKGKQSSSIGCGVFVGVTGGVNPGVGVTVGVGVGDTGG
jgi:hypothetical protein